MTEYDYSPGAYERHLAKQRQIADWVGQTQQNSPANPFVPSVASTYTSHNNRERQTSSRSSSSSRPSRSSGSRHRSASVDHSRHVSILPNVPTHRPATVRMYSQPHLQPNALYPSSPNPYLSSSHPTSRSSSVIRNSITSAPPHTLPYRTIHPDSHNPTYITASPTDPIVVPIGGGRKGYIVVPPVGSHMEVVNPHHRRVEKEAEQPFFKRLFGSFQPSRVRSRSSKSSSHGRRNRRDSY